MQRDQEVVLAVEVEEPPARRGCARSRSWPRMSPSASAGRELAPDDAPPVAQPDLAERHRADDQRRRLRARVAAARDDERDEEREHDRARDLVLEVRPSRVAVSISPTNSADSQPARFGASSPKPTLEVGRVEGLHAAELLDVLGGLFLHDVDDVVDGDDALHAALGVDDRDGDEVVLGEELARPPPGPCPRAR